MPIVPLLGEWVNRAEAPPSQPELNVRDSLTEQNTPVTGLYNWDDSYMQTQAVAFSPLDFEKVGVGLGAGSYSETVWIKRKHKVLIQLLATDAAAALGVRLGLEDRHGLWWYTAKETLNASVIQRDSLYLVDLWEHETLGAQRAKIYIESISAGTVDICIGSA